TLDTSLGTGGAVTPLLTTSRAGGVRTAQMILSPTQEFPRDSLATRVVAVQVNAPAQTGSQPGRGRLIVVGSADFASDRYLRGGETGGVFAQNRVDCLDP